MYEIYHSAKSGNIWAGSRTRKASAIKVAEKIDLAKGEWVTVLKSTGPYPGDHLRIYRREA